MSKIKILIDGDACAVITKTEKIAASNNIDCHVYCNTNNEIKTNSASIHIVDMGADSADFAIINDCVENDIVITCDSGLAAMVLAKKACVLNPKGYEYTDENIMAYLTSRHIRKQRKTKTQRNQIKGTMPYENAKRQKFTVLLENTIQKLKDKGGQDS